MHQHQGDYQQWLLCIHCFNIHSLDPNNRQVAAGPMTGCTAGSISCFLLLCCVQSTYWNTTHPPPTIPPAPHEMPFGGSHCGTGPPQSIGVWGQGEAWEAWVILCHGTKRSTRAGINYVWHHFLLHGKDMQTLGKSSFNICIINRKLAQSNSTFCYNCCLQMDERPAEKHEP